MVPLTDDFIAPIKALCKRDQTYIRRISQRGDYEIPAGVVKSPSDG